MDLKERIKRTNKMLACYPVEELQKKADEHNKKAHEDFEKMKNALSQSLCFFCSQPITFFDKNSPCLHWLFWEAKGLKKKHFPSLFNKEGFHQISAYLRWVANCDRPFVNINDLVEEGKPSNIIDLTVRYKNLEWSFICSINDRKGHEGTHEGKDPHYHFQMKKNGQVVLNYNGFHFAFTDYDEFCFAVSEEKFNKLRASEGKAAGIQTVLDTIDPQDLINTMSYTKNEDDALLKTDILIESEEGHTISEDEIADLIQERNKTGISMAKLVEKLKNVKITRTMSPGSGVPKKSKRNPNRNC